MHYSSYISSVVKISACHERGPWFKSPKSFLILYCNQQGSKNYFEIKTPIIHTCTCRLGLFQRKIKTVSSYWSLTLPFFPRTTIHTTHIFRASIPMTLGAPYPFPNLPVVVAKGVFSEQYHVYHPPEVRRGKYWGLGVFRL